MARLRRLQFPGGLYHVMSRGNRKLIIFDDDDDRGAFVRTVADAVERYGIRCLAFCLMPNHYHLVLETPHGNLSTPMQFLNGVYTQTNNRRHRRTGHVFGGRFRSIVVQRESYLRRLARYVVRNPVRAGLVSAADEWEWSSYRATAGLEPPPCWLSVDWLCTAFDAPSSVEAQERYRCFVNAPRPGHAAVDLRALVLGDAGFVSALQEAARGRWPDRVLARLVLDAARPSLDVALGGINGPGPQRDRAIRTAHVVYGYKLSEIASHLRVDRAVASRALRRLRRVAAEPTGG